MIDYKELAKEEFKIPNLLQEREEQMRKEYDERQAVEVDKLGITHNELAQMKQLDMMYGGQTTQEEIDEINDEEEQLLLDPYMKKKERYVKPQQFRTIKVGPSNLLKNGQMIQVNICDAFDQNVFHPTDKVLLLKLND